MASADLFRVNQFFVLDLFLPGQDLGCQLLEVSIVMIAGGWSDLKPAAGHSAVVVDRVVGQVVEWLDVTVDPPRCLCFDLSPFCTDMQYKDASNSERCYITIVLI